MSKSLMQIANENTYLRTIFEDLEGEIPEDSNIEELWEDNTIELAEKLDAYGFVINQIDNTIDYLKEGKRKDTEIIKTLESKKARLKKTLYQVAQAINGGNTLRGNRFTISPRVNQKTIIDETKLPDSYKRYDLKGLTKTQLIFLYNLLNGFKEDHININKNIAPIDEDTMIEKQQHQDDIKFASTLLDMLMEAQANFRYEVDANNAPSDAIAGIETTETITLRRRG